MAVEVHVPVLGESVTEATVGKWYKAVGEAVAVDEVICELETDKVALEVTAFGLDFFLFCVFLVLHWHLLFSPAILKYIYM